MVARIKLSGLQREALSLMRSTLRYARKQNPEVRQNIEDFARQEFRKNSVKYDKKDYQAIEYLLKKGKRQLDQLANSDTTGFNVVHIHR